MEQLTCPFAIEHPKQHERERGIVRLTLPLEQPQEYNSVWLCKSCGKVFSPKGWQKRGKEGE